MGVTSFSNCSAAVSCLINPDKILAILQLPTDGQDAIIYPALFASRNHLHINAPKVLRHWYQHGTHIHA